MYSSPGSDATSSDLYSTSEPDDEAEPPSQSQTSSVVTDVRQLSSANPVPGLEGRTITPARGRSRADNVPLPSGGRTNHETTPGMLYAMTGPSDNAAEGPHKRKRDDCQTTCDNTSFRRSSYQMGRLSPLPDANSRGHQMHPSSSTSGRDSLLNHSPDNKRTRISGDFSGALTQATSGATDSRDARLPHGPSGLPAEIWQHIFHFVPPVSLGRLLRVNRAFNRYLAPRKADEKPNMDPVRGVVHPVHPEVIWAASRKRFCPGLPKPMRDVPELVMWRMLRGKNCQVCKETKVPSVKDGQTNQWEAGPGDDGIRVIWPFGIRCCGKCLQEQSEKEVTLDIFSAFPRYLKPALPFALVTSSNHFIPSTLVRTNPPPTTLVLTKLYYKPHLQEMDSRLEEVKELGPATAEEWIKGLDREGKDRLNDSARWEQWEAKGGLKKVNSRPQPRKSIHPRGSITEMNDGKIKGETHSDRSTPQSGIYGPGPTEGRNSPVPGTFVDSPQPAYFGPSSLQPRHPVGTPTQDGFPIRPPGQFQQARAERSIHDVNEAKAARRAEIERRCMNLNPPIKPSVLHLMESFQAAIQISTGLTDQAWQVLKPRLLAQRDEAERREHEKFQQSQILSAKFEERRQQEAQLKDTKERLEREWEEIQAPVRDRLALYADEFIDSRWRRGKSITKDTSPKFAADVLIHVRQRFYDYVTSEDAAARAAGELIRLDPPNGPPTRKLILENMKWLFDTKIKPLTEHFQKELFLCNDCEGNFKFYGFEGVIQHYAAKHTTTLSMGSVVVYWRAEWPEHPPFHPNPTAAKAQHYLIPTPMSTSVQGQYGRPPQIPHPPYGNGYGPTTDPGPQYVPQPYSYAQYSPAPYRAGFPGHAGEGPYQPPPTHYPYSHGGQESTAYQPPGLYGPGFSGPENRSSGIANGHSRYGGPPYGQPPQGYVSSSYPNRSYAGHPQNQQMEYLGNNVVYPIHTQEPGSVAIRAPAFVPRPLPHQRGPDDSVRTGPSQIPDLYQLQMDEMAQHARDVWFGTSGIKDIPSSVRISVVIHHVVARFEAKYTNAPRLEMFIDGLEHKPLMKPIRGLNGLACKTCVTTGTVSDASVHSHPQLVVGERKLYTLSHLLTHFRTVHIERTRPIVIPQTGIEALALDWKHDMIELPRDFVIADLIHAPGMDDSKLQLIAWAFPSAFPPPLPRLGAAGNTGPVPVYREDPLPQNDSPMSNHEPFLKESTASPHRANIKTEDWAQDRPYDTSRPPSRPIIRSSETPGDDEYDPHRPAYLGKIVRPPLGPSRPHSIRRQSPSPDRSRSRLRTRRDDYPIRSALSLEITQDVHSPAALTPTYVKDHLSRFRQRSESRRRSNTPRGRTRALDSPYGSQRFDHFDHPAPADSSGLNTTPPPAENAYRHVSEDGEVGEDPPPLEHQTRDASPIEGISAADRFLNEIEPGPDADDFGRISKHASDREDRPGTPWTEDRNDVHRASHVMESADDRAWGSEVGSRHTEGNDLHVSSIRTGPSGSNLQSPLAKSTAYHHDDHDRSLSNAPIPIDYVPSSERSPEPYPAREPRPPVILEDRYSDTHQCHPSPENRYERFVAAQVSNYRNRSRSPPQIPLEAAYYRARSPVVIPRHESVYRVRSPSLHHDLRAQRVPSYEYSLVRDRYGYIKDRDYPEEQSRRRIGYVPVQMEERGSLEPSRYVVAHPLEHRDPPGFVRFERGYGGQPIFERNGQLYQADPRAYEARHSRAPRAQEPRYEY